MNLSQKLISILEHRVFPKNLSLMFSMGIEKYKEILDNEKTDEEKKKEIKEVIVMYSLISAIAFSEIQWSTAFQKFRVYMEKKDESEHPLLILELFTTMLLPFFSEYKNEESYIPKQDSLKRYREGQILLGAHPEKDLFFLKESVDSNSYLYRFYDNILYHYKKWNESELGSSDNKDGYNVLVCEWISLSLHPKILFPKWYKENLRLNQIVQERVNVVKNFIYYFFKRPFSYDQELVDNFLQDIFVMGEFSYYYTYSDQFFDEINVGNPKLKKCFFLISHFTFFHHLLKYIQGLEPGKIFYTKTRLSDVILSYMDEYLNTGKPSDTIAYNYILSIVCNGLYYYNRMFNRNFDVEGLWINKKKNTNKSYEEYLDKVMNVLDRVGL